MATYYERNKEKMLAYNRAYREAHKDYFNQRSLEYYYENKDVIKERNKLQKAARDKAYYEANRDRIREQQRLYKLKKRMEHQQKDSC